jgi:hypothetical protein
MGHILDAHAARAETCAVAASLEPSCTNLCAQLVQHVALVCKLCQPFLLCCCGMPLSLNITLQADNN